MSDVRAEAVRDRVEVYAAWVRRLRTESLPPGPIREPDDPLGRLGEELELLSAEVARREAAQSRLLDLVQTVDRGVLLDDVLSRIFEAFRGVIPFDRIGCAFLSGDGERLVAYWAYSELGPVRLPRGFSQPMAGSSLERVVASGQPRILNDLESYLAAKPDSASTRAIVAEGGRSSLTCPLVLEGRPIGFLFFTSRHADAYSAAHQSIFRQIANQVASVIEKGRLHDELISHNRRLVEHNTQLRALADTDGLTGVLTRRALDEAVDRAWQGYVARGEPFGVILADVDHFKRINDTFGHAAGDEVLREVVSRLLGQLRRADTCGRYGGEEFLIILPGASEAQSLAAAERLRGAVADGPIGACGGAIVTASFGIAHVDRASSSGEAVVRLADAALYQAKAAGRNRCVTAGAPTVS